MEPLQGQAKTTVLRKFILLYGLSLAVIFGVVYFAFNTPASLFKKSIQQYKTAQLEQGALLDQTDAITTYMNKIIETDHSYQLAVSVPDKEKLKETLGSFTNEISTALQDFENDSASRRTDFSKRHANHYMFMFRNFLEYRDAFSNDFAALESRKDLPLQFKIALDSLRSSQMQREYLKSLLAQSGSRTTSTVQPVSSSPSGNDAAIRAANERQIDELQNRLRQSQIELTNCNQQKASISQSVSQAATDLPQQQMASLLTDAGKKIYSQALQGKNFKGGTIEQRAFFACARQVFEEAKSHYASADIDTYLRNIDAQIKKLSY
jgi:hypothetical protein